MTAVIPVVLMAYARADCLVRTLNCLRENQVPLILAYADGAKDSAEDQTAVEAVRKILREVDWCELRLVERVSNLGLGRNILSAVSEVSTDHGAFVVWEDDLVCAPGTYAWLCAALRHYEDVPRVMSVSAWNHRRVTPSELTDGVYFDGRAECWVWGAYARSWRGMLDEDAMAKLYKAESQGTPSDAYGVDLPRMAAEEFKRNTWATRWLYHHFVHGGLCLRPVRSLVDHIGVDDRATNAGDALEWRTPGLPDEAEIPTAWPAPAEHPDCRAIWQAVNPPRSVIDIWRRRVWRRLPYAWLQLLRRAAGRPGFYGHYRSWEAAQARSRGYASAAIVERVVATTRRVRDGALEWERDSVGFHYREVNGPLLATLRAAIRAKGSALRVLDFGGALGSVWWQHRRELSNDIAAWCIVEQTSFVDAGKAEFEVGPLAFCASIEEACKDGDPDLVLFSSVLAYLAEPYALLRKMAELRECRWIVLDRAGFNRMGGDRLTVQHVPAEIYPASYPCWFLDEERVAKTLGPAWHLENDWLAYPPDRSPFWFRGLAFRRAG